MNPLCLLGVLAALGKASKCTRPLSGPRFLAKSLFGKEVQRFRSRMVTIYWLNVAAA